MKIDEWIAGLQKTPLSSPSPEHHEGTMIRDLVQEYAQERQKKHFDKLLEDIRQSGLLEIEKNNPLPQSTIIHNPLPSIEIASNEPRFLWVAASMVILVSAIGIGTYLFLSQSSNDSVPNAYYSTEGLVRMRGASQEPQFIPVPKGKTTKQVAVQVQEILERHNISHEPPFEASGGRIQFLAIIPHDSPAREELKRMGVDVAVNSNEENFIVNFVLIQIP